MHVQNAQNGIYRCPPLQSLIRVIEGTFARRAPHPNPCSGRPSQRCTPKHHSLLQPRLPNPCRLGGPRGRNGYISHSTPSPSGPLAHAGGGGSELNSPPPPPQGLLSTTRRHLGGGATPPPPLDDGDVRHPRRAPLPRPPLPRPIAQWARHQNQFPEREGVGSGWGVQGDGGRRQPPGGGGSIVVVYVPLPSSSPTRHHRGGRGGGGGTPPPLKDRVKFSSGPSVNQKFSSVPSAPLKAQHHRGGGGGGQGWTPPQKAPSPPLWVPSISQPAHAHAWPSQVSGCWRWSCSLGMSAGARTCDSAPTASTCTPGPSCSALRRRTSCLTFPTRSRLRRWSCSTAASSATLRRAAPQKRSSGTARGFADGMKPAGGQRTPAPGPHLSQSPLNSRCFD